MNSTELKFLLWLCISITYNSCETDSRSRSQDPVVIKDPFSVKTVRKGRKNKHAKMHIISFLKRLNFLNIILNVKIYPCRMFVRK